MLNNVEGSTVKTLAYEMKKKNYLLTAVIPVICTKLGYISKYHVMVTYIFSF